MNGKLIQCKYVQFDDAIWESLACISLVDVVTGGEVREATRVQVCWDSLALYLRFVCMDEYVISQYTHHDDPLYEQDVVEVFIDEEGSGSRYMELELSPYNIVLDAIVQNDQGSLTLDIDWNAAGLVTKVHTEGNLRIYEIRLPFVNFRSIPEEGVKWKVNFYRIDEAPDGKRHYQAWSPTGAVNYHIPSRFGTLLFV